MAPSPSEAMGPTMGPGLAPGPAPAASSGEDKPWLQLLLAEPRFLLFTEYDCSRASNTGHALLLATLARVLAISRFLITPILSWHAEPVVVEWGFAANRATQLPEVTVKVSCQPRLVQSVVPPCLSCAS